MPDETNAQLSAEVWPGYPKTIASPNPISVPVPNVSPNPPFQNKKGKRNAKVYVNLSNYNSL